MVKVIDFKERKSSKGDIFYVLVVQNGVEPVKSLVTGQFYFKLKTAYVGTAFDAETCRSLIGEEYDGHIEKQECEPYSYEVEETGETIEFNHRNVFVAEASNSIEHHLIDEKEVV